MSRPRWARFYPAERGRKSHVVDKLWPRVVEGKHYGQAIAQAWRPGSGLVVLEWDVAFDLEDQLQLERTIAERPDQVVAAPVRLYPVTHGKPGLVAWGHRRQVDRELRWIEEGEQASHFTLCMTYLPDRLLAALAPVAGEPRFDYPSTDEALSQLAAELGIGVFVDWRIRPKHLHW